MRSTTSVSVPRDALCRGMARRPPCVGQAERLGEVGGQVGLGRRVPHQPHHAPRPPGSGRAARRAARVAAPANSRRCRAASAGYCARPCLTSVCQPEHQRWTGRVAVRTSVTSLLAQHLLEGSRGPARARGRGPRSRAPACRPRCGGPRRGRRRATAARAPRPWNATTRRARSGARPSVNAVSSGRNSRWCPAAARRRRRVPDVRVVGVRTPPRLLQRRRPRLVQPRVDDDLHAGSLGDRPFTDRPAMGEDRGTTATREAVHAVNLCPSCSPRPSWPRPFSPSARPWPPTNPPASR